LAAVIGLSVTWSSGAETALLVGGAVGLAAIGVLVIARLFLQRRAAPG
jgi:hypothetical protein